MHLRKLPSKLKARNLKSTVGCLFGFFNMSGWSKTKEKISSKNKENIFFSPELKYV